MARYVLEGFLELRSGGIEIPHPELRREVQGARMGHAAVGGDDAGSGNLLPQTLRHAHVAAQQNGEPAHVFPELHNMAGM